MATDELVDYSPHQSVAAAPLSNATNVILIDNFDSFTWNVYQYLVLEGASVTVYRNNEITVSELAALKPTQLVISPGPGHPRTDSGISRDAIKHFAGKIPILGVCMGQQAIIDVFGGDVSFAGEILHGKTSPLRHDTKGIYRNIPQDLPVTRYHSLAGTHPSIPACLEVSSWIATGNGDGKGIIMGVRHREMAIEAVQYHPESILTAEGRLLIKNFLGIRGGTWAENSAAARSGHVERPMKPTEALKPSKQGNILDEIFAARREAVAIQKEIPSQRFSDLQTAYDLGLAPPLTSFVKRLQKTPYTLALMAEIKRASPSKGIISLSTCAPSLARTYALAGASVISVLTEPQWFKGSLEDLRYVRQALDAMPNRPAILRKEFIFDEYQILEARLAGADTVLLIVKMLDREILARLYHYSRSLGMEPLVEVNTATEMSIAIELGAQVIGVNNRDLTSFEVDLGTTSRLMTQASRDTIICALSGISGPDDVAIYRKAGVKAVLVGEALMRARDTSAFIKDLLGGASPQAQFVPSSLLVKICGTRTAEAAEAAVQAGADLIGMILVPGRSRHVQYNDAIAISKVVRSGNARTKTGSNDRVTSRATDFFADSAATISSHRALLVGVFQNQPLEEVLELQKAYDLDIVQLHGDEPLEWARLIPVPVIRSFKPGQSGINQRGYHKVSLLDSGSGGSGTQLDMSQVRQVLMSNHELRVLLAGGLNPGNVAEAIHSAGDFGHRIIGVDVSSGVEENGAQSLEKIREFIAAAKAIR